MCRMFFASRGHAAFAHVYHDYPLLPCCMRAALLSQVPNLAATVLLLLLLTTQTVSFVSPPSQFGRFSLPPTQQDIRSSAASLANRTPPRAPGSPGVPTGVLSCAPLARRFRNPPLGACFSSPGAAAVADKTITETTEMANMPELKVLRVDEVPTVKADPVDPVARGQAKVNM